MKKTLIALLFLSAFSFAQEQTISLGKAELKLGTDKEVVLNLLDKLFFVEEANNDETIFFVWDSNKRNYNYGEIKFDELNKLSSIVKNWSTVVNDSNSQIYEQLIKLINGYKSNGDIKVDTQEIFEPNYTAKTISFVQGKKVIELSLLGNRIILKEYLKELNN
jgi:hypothetical protein